MALVNKVDESGFIEFASQHTNYTITVFTNVDCGYCQLLHRNIKA